MATNTYVALYSNTLTTSTATVSISAISQAYTDLEIVIGNATNLTGNSDVLMRFNSDSTGSYSATILGGDGSSAYSYRRTNSTSVICNYFNFLNTSPATQFNIKIQNYSNATTTKPVLIRANRAAQATEAIVGVWRATPAAITQIDLSLGSSSFAAGTTFTVYGITAAAPLTTKATGGTIKQLANGYVTHTFTSSGTFTPTSGLEVEYLVVAGGGGGATYSGGAGAGGLLQGTTTVASGTPYTVTVGAGGAGALNAAASNGSSSVFGAVTASGGAGGGYTTSQNGASGSGGGIPGADGVDYPGGTGIAGQGYPGGTGHRLAAGGGGGAGGPGANYSANIGGNGGIGIASSISGVSTYYAGGGGGLGWTSDGIGGLGGGGTRNVGGTVNTGGGSGSQQGDGNPGQSGGSGIVIIRYLG